MGHEKYMLGICRKTLWAPSTEFSKIYISYRFFHALSDKTCCQKQITGDMVKIANVKKAAMQKCWKMKNKNFRNSTINYHR